MFRFSIRSFLTAFFLAFLSGSLSFAGGEGTNPSLSWEQFKESCLRPEQFNSQVPPTQIRIQCTDVTTEFVSIPPGEIPLSASRQIVSAVFSNKYYVDAQKSSAAMLTRTGSCMRFKEVEKTVTIERELSCNEILSIKSSLSEFCTSNLNFAKGANPKLVDVHDTGRHIDTCERK